MRFTARRLQLLNLVRWIRENLAFWGVLCLIYSYTLTLMLQPMLEAAFKREIAVGPLWFTTCALLIVPAYLESWSLPPLPLPPGLFGERAWSRPAGALGPLYLRHELRRGATWASVVIAVLVTSLLPERLFPLWVLAAQLPAQRALYSVHRWRALALAQRPRGGGADLIGALWVAQTLQYAVAWLSLGAVGLMGMGLGLDAWLKLGAAGLGAVWSAAAVTMEGDSGRPWLVNFIALAAGALGGFLCLASPGFLLLVFYAAYKMREAAGTRLYSVEHMDEDVVIS